MIKLTELAEEIEAFIERSKHRHNRVTKDMSVPEAETNLTALRQSERAGEDAERYKWLRGQHWNDSPLSVVQWSNCPSEERLDAAIDAARALLDKSAEGA